MCCLQLAGWYTFAVDRCPCYDIQIYLSAVRQLVIHLAYMFTSLTLDGERVGTWETVTRVAVMTVGDGLDAGPHVSSEEVHVCQVGCTVRRHQ